MINRFNYTQQQIDAALRFPSGSRKVTFRYDLLNRHDIKIDTLKGITGKVSYGAFRAIPRSATFTLDEYLQKEINYLSDQIQPWFILHMPDGGTVEWPLGIFLLESPDRVINSKVKTREIGAYDKTIIIDEYRFTQRHFIAAGTNYIGAIIRILTLAGIQKINIESSSLTLTQNKEFAAGVKGKEAITELLNEINYNSISVDEVGNMGSSHYVEPSKRPITQQYSTDKFSILTPDFKEDTGLAGRPNVFIAIAKNIESETELTASFINDDPLSPVSTVSRGRQIAGDPYELESIADQATLNNYIRRIAVENSSGYSKLTFGTALMPTHGSSETLFLNIPTVFDTAVKFQETSWEMPLTFDGVMTHEARRVVRL